MNALSFANAVADIEREFVRIPEISNFALDVQVDLNHDAYTEDEFNAGAYKALAEVGGEFLSNLDEVYLHRYTGLTVAQAEQITDAKFQALATMLYLSNEGFRNHFASYYSHSIVARIYAAHRKEKR